MVKSHTPAGGCCLQAYVVSCSAWLLQAHVVWQKAETARPDAGPALFLLHPIGQGHHRLPGIGENGEIDHQFGTKCGMCGFANESLPDFCFASVL